MLATDDNGRVLNAKYAVEADRGLLALVLESAGGATGGRAARNTDYRPALAVLLTRLRDLDCVIQDALVDSGFTQQKGIEEAQRRLVDSPIRLSDEPDIEALRLRLTSAQAKIGQAPDVSKGGNSSKRIRLRLEVPGYGIEEADRLATDLATPAHVLDDRVGRVGRDSQRDASRPRSSQPSKNSGRLDDVILRAAIEKHAVDRTMAHYSKQGYVVTDVGNIESYDVCAIKGIEELHVEVKGSIRSADVVELTTNEVNHARRVVTDLVVVDQIQWERLPDGTILTSGGRFRCWACWQPADADLRPARYQYRLPA
jgi:hypothetical protein